MVRQNWPIVLLAICCFQASSLLAQVPHDAPCGDWEQYKNEKCFKVLTSLGAISFEKAQKECETAGGHLISIKFAEEQPFLSNFLFNKSKVVDGVWLNVRFHSNKLKLEQDGSDVQFTNWVTGHPKATTDDRCVQMDPELDSKWLDDPCTRAGAVVCQKSQTWSIDKLQQTLLDTIKQLEMTQNQFKESQIQLKDTQTQLKDTQNRLTTSESQLKETNTRVEKLEKNPVPLGFLYSQLGGQSEPVTLWPATKWEEVSGNYAGQFFRVVGGDAAQFGELQEGHAPRLVGAKFTASVDYKSETVLSANDAWSEYIYSGNSGGSGTQYYHSFKISSGEVRPRNQAMRLWKRTG